MVGLPGNQEEEETPPIDKVASGTNENEKPEGLLDEPSNVREDEEFPSNSKVDPEARENAPDEGLLEELLLSKEVEEAPYNFKVAPRINKNGHPITVTALVHSEAYFTDSEDSERENDNMHQSTLFLEEESPCINTPLQERKQDTKTEKNEEVEMKSNVIEELNGEANIECEHGSGDKESMIKTSGDPTTENGDAELEASS
ncbi:uncharacterized protein LOC119525010 [Choloepus didactylus]|uniref:uncharacterized protein LOC119525010 n=1 Tax=Choloepus didactylus TaxID=27675 RepID=UPI00189C59DE|nr:uncharacterized protein LOC119525010 [Choloepus didactylus]